MIKITGRLLLVLISVPVLLTATAQNKAGEFYQVTVYHFTDAAQQQIISHYLQDALVPALHRQNIRNVGVFVPLMNDTVQDKRLFVFFPLRSLQQSADLTGNLMKDQAYLSGGDAYLNATYDHAPYSRKETMLLQAFPMATSMQLPKLSAAKTDRVYEFRSYESPTEKLHLSKVHMFNEGGEIALFKRLNFNGIFYSAVVAGSRMPNLVYMTSFESLNDRNEHWKTFSADAEWKKLSALPTYQHNVSKSDIILMKPVEYSDF